ncbi:uncharacterized protein C5L36_0A07040 [Pichia kudriavzevii]|uniref:Trafficking protein particle complex subunit n=1 Tax=Pichia kudriavzevii TaxID=4909 RepID=A0A2U9QYJ6_PICKU|nr:uncharacterized protein C5L36_0A07040 [Pichia kudriavzevii]AWU74101.1 hypothetical protein C5L36_0A07040 [Pichia kudriavzevii]
MSYYFAIVDAASHPVYELSSQDSSFAMAAMASLDILESVQFKENKSFFPNIDTYNSNSIHIYLTLANTKFILISDSIPTDNIRLFCMEINELYIKKSLSPFHEYNTPIRSKAFHQRVKHIASKYLL